MARSACCACRGASSSPASCCTSCPAGSSASGTMACSRQRERSSGWRRRARHWPCRRRKRRSSNRSPPSCAGSLVLSRCAARIAVVSFWLLPHSCRRPEPGDRRETARQTRASGINEEWPGHSRQLAPGVWPDRVRSVRQRPSGTFTPVQSGACHCHKARNSPIRQPASCHSLDFGQAPLTIPITSARPALQSNEVYPPI